MLSASDDVIITEVMSQLDQVPEQHRHIRSFATGLARRLVGLLAVVALLTLTAVEAPGASLRILFRFAILSFDHPSTQALDEVACESWAPGGVETEDRFSRLVPSGRFVSASEPSRLVSSMLFSGITRSPPAA